MLAKILTALNLNSPDSMKRALATILGAVCLLIINPLLSKLGLPGVSDSIVVAIAGMIAGYVFQSGLKSAAMAKLTPEQADKILAK